MIEEDPYADLKAAVRLTPELQAKMEAALVKKNGTGTTSRQADKNRKFVMLPWSWVEQLQGASGGTYAVAITLLWLHWRQKGGPVKLTNKAPGLAGTTRFAKKRALANLEQLGLISVERRPRKSPLIRVKP